MRSREDGTAARTATETAIPAVSAEADELAAARRTVDEALAALQSGPDLASRPRTLKDAIVHLRGLVGARMAELDDKRATVEAANGELRNLTRNLDSIVRQRTRALAESESQLRRKNLELDRLNRLRTEFIAIAAHELRTPMTSLVGYLDLFSERVAPEMTAESRRQLGSLHRNAHRLKRLIEDMLDVSRLDSGSVTLRRAPVALPEVVLAVVDELGPIVGDCREIELQLQLADIPAIDADADKVHQVVTNLLANSMKFSRASGQIRISVDVDPTAPVRMARLRVWDNGQGIPAELRSQIFDPFLDVATAKHHTSAGPDSAGLGLRIARGIIELHGGTIHVDSVEGQFTEFTVLMPIVS